ncbi:hypothetical protein AgCh_034694 [Apium graveolens]
MQGQSGNLVSKMKHSNVNNDFTANMQLNVDMLHFVRYHSHAANNEANLGIEFTVGNELIRLSKDDLNEHLNFPKVDIKLQHKKEMNVKDVLIENINWKLNIAMQEIWANQEAEVASMPNIQTTDPSSDPFGYTPFGEEEVFRVGENRSRRGILEDMEGEKDKAP